MSKEKGVARPLGPAGSLQPIDRTGKWHAEIDGASLAELMKIEREIGKVIGNTQAVIAKSYIRIGTLLSDARSLFPGDKEFGQWREEKLPALSRSQAYALMRVSSNFKDAPTMLEKCGYTTLRELSYAPPALVEWVEKNIKEGVEPPTPAEAKQLVKDAKSPAPEEREGKPPPGWGTTDRKDKSPARVAGTVDSSDAPIISQTKVYASYSRVLAEEFNVRWKIVSKDFSRNSLLVQGYLLLGVDPNPSASMSVDTWECLASHYGHGLEEGSDDYQFFHVRLLAVRADIDNFN